MDEEITIINTNTRNEKIKNFFLNNKKVLIVITASIISLLVGYFLLVEIKKRNKGSKQNKISKSVQHSHNKLQGRK